MKAMIAAVAIALSLAFATNSAYAGRVANTAIGTLAGLVVFGPVGAVAALQWDILPATVLHALGGYLDRPTRRLGRSSEKMSERFRRSRCRKPSPRTPGQWKERTKDAGGCSLPDLWCSYKGPLFH